MQLTSTTKTLREQLREATHPFHMALENELGLLSPNLSLSDYKKTLFVFYRFYKTFEEALRTRSLSLAAEFYLNDRTKCPALEMDLGVSDCFDLALLPDLKSEAQIWGALYVIEGSSLGGQMIVKHFAQKFPNQSHHFFSGYGRETGKKWQAYLKRLEDLPVDQHQEAILSGVETFKVLLKNFKNL